jgi:hypothetical protein
MLLASAARSKQTEDMFFSPNAGKVHSSLML